MEQSNSIKTTDITDEKQIKPWLFKKGQSGNPNGRPSGSVSITAEIKKKLQEIPEGQQKSYLELLINRILKQAVVDGNEQMIKQIWNYIDGPPRQAEDPELVAPVVHVNFLNKDDIKVREESGEKILA
ncbi:MAG: DUF5681 domain-containing protein [Candidatus Staskawiczbacteria bacterium]|nr:DUF5681 domain-containing protein [Candidatus Staskawiczbacteria bacterium]